MRRPATAPTRAPANADNTSVATLAAVERAQIELALRVAAGHRGQAAKMLGISERNLYRKLHEYELET